MITWEQVKDFFTPSEVACMKAASQIHLDLGSFDSVKINAITIWEHVAVGAMPLVYLIVNV